MFTSVILAQGLIGTAGDSPNQLSDLGVLFANVLRAVVPGAGIALFVVLLLAGYNFVSAGSDPKKAQQAQAMATYAIYGIILIALSYLILRVIAFFTGVEGILNFQVCNGPC